VFNINNLRRSSAGAPGFSAFIANAGAPVDVPSRMNTGFADG
jgi:hypothetical protein